MTTEANKINGDPDLLLIDRARLELRRGRAIELCAGSVRFVIAAAELIQQTLLERMRRAGAPVRLVLASQRAIALNLPQSDQPIAVIAVQDDWSGADLRAIAGSSSVTPKIEPDSSPTDKAEYETMAAALRFMKSGQQLPALVWTEHDGHDPSLLSVDIEALSAEAAFISNYRLRRVSEGRVPLADAVDSRLAVFRDDHTLNEHLAVIIGEPDMEAAVPVRMHSACLTGDLLGSLRCDCGEQLRTAVSRIAELGGGVLLYLDQEGRGIGLANKMRAYSLQDEGLDTLDANEHLGFLADERTYRAAAVMLRDLGIERVCLLTNNPKKIESLKDHGIAVTGRVPLIAEATEHNKDYLRTKRERAGHLAEDSGS